MFIATKCLAQRPEVDGAPMIAQAFRIDRERHLIPASLEEAVEARRSEGAPIWVDVASPTADGLDEWLERFEVRAFPRQPVLGGWTRLGLLLAARSGHPLGTEDAWAAAAAPSQNCDRVSHG